jgi:hypothetical protein
MNSFLLIFRKASGEIELIEGETQLDNKDYKNTLKLTWLAETSLAPLTPITCTHYDNIMSKEKLDEGDTFENFVNYASKVKKKISFFLYELKFPFFRLNMILSVNLIWHN